MGKVLVLRTSDKNRRSYGGFQYPETGYVEALDWSLHGLLCGQGKGYLLNWKKDAVWQVLEVEASEIVDLGNKVKFRRGKVVHSGNRMTATEYLFGNGCQGLKVVGSVLTGGDDSTLTGGDCSVLTGGNCSVLTGGDCSALTGGDYSVLTGGDGSALTGGNYSVLTGGVRSKLTGGADSTLTGGNYSVLTGGVRSKLTGGDDSKLTGGDCSVLTGGNCSVLTGGDYSTLTGGDYSVLTGGGGSALTGGDGSTLTISYILACGAKRRIAVAQVGDGIIEAKVPYVLKDGKFVKKER